MFPCGRVRDNEATCGVWHRDGSMGSTQMESKEKGMIVDEGIPHDRIY